MIKTHPEKIELRLFQSDSRHSPESNSSRNVPVIATSSLDNLECLWIEVFYLMTMTEDSKTRRRREIKKAAGLRQPLNKEVIG